MEPEKKAFSDLLHGTVCKFAASVFDPISVRMASDLGFEVAIQGGSVASLQVLGAPDISLLEDSIARTTAYQKAGADAICLVGVKDFQHLEALTAHLSVPIMLINYGNRALSDVEKLSAAHVRIVVNGHAPYLSAIKATYEALRDQSGMEGSELSLPELLSKYTLSDNYREWAKIYLKSNNGSN